MKNLQGEIEKIVHNYWKLTQEEMIAQLLVLFDKHTREVLEKVNKWAKEKNNDSDLVATSDLMRFLANLKLEKQRWLKRQSRVLI